jgi:hypothetical protein
MDIEQAADPQQHVRGPFAQGNQNEVLTDLHLVRGIHQEVVGKRG